MLLRQVQKQKLIQKLSPQQIQLMKLLQVPTANLEDRIREELEANPALEPGSSESENSKDILKELEDERIKDSHEDDYESSDETENLDFSDYLQDEDSYGNTNYYEDNDDDDEPVAPTIKVENTFHDYLDEQLGTLALNEKEYTIALQIIGSIDDDGYLRREPLSIADDLAFKQNLIVSEKEVLDLIAQIQLFDPAGVAAQDLQECLLLQLDRIPDENDSKKIAIEIIKENLDAFSKKHYDKILQKLKISTHEFKDANELILKLTPKPGAAFNHTGKSTNYIISDFFVYNNNGKLELTLNSKNAPELHISDGYMEMMKSYQKDKNKSNKEKEALLFIKQKIDSAKWFIDAIKQRQHTLLVTMNAIMEYQEKFFLSGDEMDLKPMILKDVSEKIDMDISTVSRVANSKYVQTEFGIFRLKHFFSEAMTTDSGEEISTREVKGVLQNIVNAENKKRPYSDEKLMELLAKKGYTIARRTIAKYREQLNIPVARLRKGI